MTHGSAREAAPKAEDLTGETLQRAIVAQATSASAQESGKALRELPPHGTATPRILAAPATGSCSTLSENRAGASSANAETYSEARRVYDQFRMAQLIKKLDPRLAEKADTL